MGVWGPWGLPRWAWAGVAPPRGRSPLAWSGWCTREPGSLPGEPGPPFTSGGWAVPRTAAPPSPLSPSAPLPGARLSCPVFHRLAPPPRGSHTWGAAWQLAAKQATSLLPSGQSFLLPLPPLPAREQQTNKQASGSGPAGPAHTCKCLQLWEWGALRPCPAGMAGQQQGTPRPCRLHSAPYGQPPLRSPFVFSSSLKLSISPGWPSGGGETAGTPG